MTDGDRIAFAKLMIGLGEVFNDPISDLRIEIYFDVLAPYGIEEIQTAAKRALTTAQYFPRPVHFIEAIEGSHADKSAEGWAHLMRAIRHNGSWRMPDLRPEIWDVVMQLWGDWRRLCETLPATGPELLGYEKRFRELYRAPTRADATARIFGMPDRKLLP